MEDAAKPDLKAGFPFDKLKDGGMILGQVDGEDVILVLRHEWPEQNAALHVRAQDQP